MKYKKRYEHTLRNKFEYIIDRMIPYILALLLVVIVLEFFFHEFALKYHLFIEFLHFFILTVFILDLVFKYLRIRTFKKFLRECWLDILAVFPFYLLFRIFEEVFVIARLAEETPRWQAVFHFERETAEMYSELEKAGKMSRFERLLGIRRVIRPLLRIPRFVKAFGFYEKPKRFH